MMEVSPPGAVFPILVLVPGDTTFVGDEIYLVAEWKRDDRVQGIDSEAIVGLVLTCMKPRSTPVLIFLSAAYCTHFGAEETTQPNDLSSHRSGLGGCPVGRGMAGGLTGRGG